MGCYDKMTPGECTKALEQISRQRRTDAENGSPAYPATHLPDHQMQ